MNFMDPAITGSTNKTIPVSTKNASRWRISGQSRQAHNATVIYVIKSPQLSSLVPVFEVTLNLRATNPSTASDSNEAARIARGNIKALSEYNAAEYDALVFPGGFGAAKNLCSFAFDGADCNVNGDVEAAIKNTVGADKPVGALCISPALIAKVLGDVKVTIGQDTGTADAIETLGGTHVKTTHGEIVVDEKYKVVTTPCYMLDATIDQIATGAENAVKKVADGTGLGMYIVKNFIESHGGKIEVKSEENKGCEIMFKLPIEE